MMLVDTHCHLYAEEFDADIDAVIGRAQAACVKKIFLPAIDRANHDRLFRLLAKSSDACAFYPMMGLHPCSVGDNWEEELAWVEQYLAQGRYYGIGEVGLDYHWDLTHVEQQKIAFDKQIALGVKYDLPVIIHSRKSTADCIDMVAKHPGARGIFHCFGGTVEEAKRIMELGFYLGIGGVVTYKNGGLKELLPQIGLSHLVLESDAPYLPPVPYRGKRNEPAYLKEICEAIAAAMGVNSEEVARLTTGNAGKVFGC
jgi:TatD DNase family protein